MCYRKRLSSAVGEVGCFLRSTRTCETVGESSGDIVRNAFKEGRQNALKGISWQKRE